MSSGLGLIELLLVLRGVMGWGAYELWSLRRPSRPARADGEPAVGASPDVDEERRPER